jgi:hypothetical protein
VKKKLQLNWMNVKMKAKLVMIGQCPECSKKYVRVPIVDAAACTCGNPDAVLVPLEPALILSASLYKRYAKIAELTGVSVEQLINALLEEAAKRKLEKLKALPNIIVTTKR